MTAPAIVEMVLQAGPFFPHPDFRLSGLAAARQDIERAFITEGGDDSGESCHLALIAE